MDRCVVLERVALIMGLETAMFASATQAIILSKFGTQGQFIVLIIVLKFRVLVR
jgi:hypothetical protein